MSTLSEGVSIRLTHSVDENGEYNAFTAVSVDIFLHAGTTKIGSIAATVVHRHRIPPGYFLSAMDGHSSDLQYVGVSIFEPKCGRCKLRSLASGGDVSHADFVYIEAFHVEEEYRKDGASDIGATALRQFLFHPFIRGSDSGRWKVTCAVYILEATAAMTESEKLAWKAERETSYQSMLSGPPVETDDTRANLNRLARMDANAFLRNGFFQDEALARKGGDRFLVAACEHWNNRPSSPSRSSRSTLLLSHAQAAAVPFYVPPPQPPDPTGLDADIFRTVVSFSCKNAHLMPGMLRDDNDDIELPRVCAEISRLVAQGGSVARSHALHAACMNNSHAMVRHLLQVAAAPQDDTVLVAANSPDGEKRWTPLMVAASCAAGRNTISGIAETRVIDALLAAGARKDSEDAEGLTAYGHFLKQTREYAVMMAAMTGRAAPPTSDSPSQQWRHPTQLAVAHKLLPPAGPTATDLTGGLTEGFVVYSSDEEEDGGDY